MSISTLLVGVTVTSTLVNAVVATWAYGRRDRVPSARSFTAMLAAQTLWAAAHVAEALAQTRDGKLLWDSLQNLPFACLPAIYLQLAARFAGVTIPRRWHLAVAAIAGACGLALATAPLHGALRGDAHLIGTPPVLTYALGWWDLVLSLVLLSTMIVAAAIVLRRSAREHGLYAAHSATVAIAFTIPALGTLLALSLGLGLDGDRDVTPVTFTLAALVAAWGLARQRLFDVAPIARDTVMMTLADPVLVLDGRARVVDLNPAALAILGVTDREVAGAPAAKVLARFPSVQALVDGGAGQVELCHAGADGVRWYEVRHQLLGGPPVRTVGSLVILRDITERKQASTQLERALAFSEGRFRALFDQIVQLTGLLDRDGRVLAANRAALELAGKTEDELIGLPFWETPWWSLPRPNADIRAAITRAAAGEQVRFETEHVDAAGQIRHIDFSLTPVRDADGRVLQLIPEGHDVTALHDQHRRAEALAGQLEQARKLESLGRLAGGIAHDFNNLLMVIRINAEEAGAALPADSPARACVEDIIEAADATAKITRQLLTFSRGQLTGLAAVEVGEVLRSSARLLERLLRGDVTLHHVAPPELWPATADPSQLQQAVINLALNAQDAMPRGGRITIDAANLELDEAAAARMPGARAGDFVRIAVDDTGTGIDAATLPHLFEPFFSTKSEAKATGLGLAVVHGAVHAAGGWIAVSSTLGRGTTFELYFPRAGAVAPTTATTAPAAGPAPASTTIAVVEDQEPLRRLIGRVLAQVGFRVEMFATPAELLARTPGPPPTLLLTDVILPGMNGFELAHTAIARWPELRVLFMSGYTGDVQAVARVNAELPLVHKPFSPAELGQRVSAALAAPPWREPADQAGGIASSSAQRA